MSDVQQCDMVAEVLARLAKHGTGNDVDDTSDDVWLQRVADLALSDDMFQAGNISQHVPAFEAYFQAAGALKRGKVKQVLRQIKHGLSIDFVHPRSAAQQEHPRFASKLRQVEQLLQQTVPAEQITSLLNSDMPQRVVFKNRVSCQQHADWVGDQIGELLRVGTLRVWQQQWGQPVVVSGMGVVPKAGNKLRLIVDLRYLNLFVRCALSSKEACTECCNAFRVRPTSAVHKLIGASIQTADCTCMWHELQVHTIQVRAAKGRTHLHQAGRRGGLDRYEVGVPSAAHGTISVALSSSAVSGCGVLLHAHVLRLGISL